MRKWNLWQVLKSVSVEPVIFLNALAVSFHNVVYRSGIYRVICNQLYPNGDDLGINCFDLSNSTYGRLPELEVQKASSDWSMTSILSYMIPATIADILLGALGDRYGRKFNIELGILGTMFAIFPVAIIFSYPKSTPLYVLVIGNIVAGLTGFLSITVISSYAYLADTVVDRDLLTVRMTLMQVCMNVGYIFGPLVASGTSKVLKNSLQEVAALSILVVAFIVGLLVLKQTPPVIMRKKMIDKYNRNKISEISVDKELAVEKNEPSTFPPTNDQQSENPRSNNKSKKIPLINCWSAFKQILWTCFCLIKEIWITFTKKRPGHTRAYILAASGVVFVSMSAEMGLRASIFSLYVQKAPLNWNQDMIGYHESVNGAVTTAGTITGIVVFKKMFGLADTTVVIIAMISGLAEGLLIGFGDRTWIIFLSAVVGCLSSLVKPCLKSFVAKLVDPDEVGKAFTVFGIAQNISFLLASVIFTKIYKATLETFPGLVFILSAIIFFLILLLVIWMHVDQKRAAGEKWHSLSMCLFDRSAKEKETPKPKLEVNVISVV